MHSSTIDNNRLLTDMFPYFQQVPIIHSLAIFISTKNVNGKAGFSNWDVLLGDKRFRPIFNQPIL